MSHYIVRNLSDQEKTQGDLIQSSTGLEFWWDFKPISKEAAQKMLRGRKIPPLSDVLLEISYTEKRGSGFVSREGFETVAVDLMAFEPGWHSAGRYHMPTLVIINSDVDGSEFRSIFRTYKKISYKVDPDAEEIDIRALSDDVIEYFACHLDLSYIGRFPNLKRLRYKNTNEDCWTRIDLSPLAQCESLESLALEIGGGIPLDLKPLLGMNLHHIGYHDFKQDIELYARGTPVEVQKVIREYQKERFSQG